MEKQEKSSYQKTELVNVIQLFFLGYYNLYVLDMVVCQRHSHYPILMIIAVCFSFWTREKTEKLWIYLFTRFGVIFFGVVIGRDEKEKVLFALTGVVISVVSWYRRININRKIYIENIGLLWLVLLLPGYLFIKIYGKTDTSNVLMGISVLFIWLYYLNRYQTNREQYFMNNKKTVGIMQDKEIRNNSNKGMLFFLVCCLTTLFLESGIYVKELEKKIGNIFFRFIKRILEILTNVKEEEYIPPEAVATPLPKIEGDGYGEAVEGFKWLRQFFKALEHIFWKILEVFWVFCIIFALFFVAYAIWHTFYHKDKQMESKNLKQENVEIIKLKKKAKKEHKGRGFKFLRNPNQRIRQLFYIEITEFQKEKSSKECMTAMELTKEVYEDRKEVAEYLLPYYQRARYSKKGITKEEVERCNKYRKDAKKFSADSRKNV